MAIATANELIHQLRLNAILSNSRMEELTKTLHRKFPEPKALAKELMRREWLTAFQVNMLLQGRGKELVFGSYILQERLSEGPMGQAYLACHQMLNRVVDLHVIRPELLADPEAVARFYREIEIASQLSHVHIVHAYDAGPIGRSHFYASEHVAGLDLEQIVRKFGPLPITEGVDFLRQTALGLQHAFERGLRHHDLRPANLLITGSDGKGSPNPPLARKTLSQWTVAQVKIRNLGLSFLQPALKSSGAVSTGKSQLERDPAADYFAPERGDSARSPDLRAELYSLGCIFYFMLTGQPPFPGGTTKEKIERHLSEDPAPIEEKLPNIPETVASVLRRLLAKRPEARYASFSELAGVLATVGPAAIDGSDTVVDAAAAETQKHSSSWKSKLFKSIQAAETAPAAEAADVNLIVIPKAVAPGDTIPQTSPVNFQGSTKWILVGAGLFMLLGLFIYVGSRVFRRTPASNEVATTQPSKETELVAPTKTPTAHGTQKPVKLKYVKKASREETILATLKENGYPSFDAPWHYIGAFENFDFKGFDTVYPPEKEFDLKKTYPGKGNEPIGWKVYRDYKVGQINNLALFKQNDNACVYLHQTIETKQYVDLPVSFGSDDTITVWLNGKQLLGRKITRGAAPDQEFLTLPLQEGKNDLLIKICNGNGEWAVYTMPLFPSPLEIKFGATLRSDFPKR